MGCAPSDSTGAMAATVRCSGVATRPRSWSTPIEYLAAVVRYIHLNAVKALMATMPEDYRWASQGDCCPGKGAQSQLNTGEVLEQIGEEEAFRRVCGIGERGIRGALLRGAATDSDPRQQRVD